MSDSNTIVPGSRVVMHFSLSLEDGTEVISTYAEEPIAFTLGDGTLEAALESKIVGQQAGDEQALLLSGNDVYGPRHSDNRQWLDIGEFPPSIELETGQVIAFTTPAGEAVAGTVEKLEGGRALMDFNHPLSGRTLIFRTTILQVEQPE
jgi:FKBP-type peptidyl-prolyl cis-trans isomerase SlpA